MAANPAHRPGRTGAERMKATVTLYIHQRPGCEQVALVANMSFAPEVYGALIGTRHVVVEFEPIGPDEIGNQLDALKKQADAERARFLERQGELFEQIDRLSSVADTPA